MSFSYTEKKRVRRSFEKISSVMELPNLLATQVQSYDAFCSFTACKVLTSLEGTWFRMLTN